MAGLCAVNISTLHKEEFNDRIEFILKQCIIEPPMGKPIICIGENKDADQLRGNREADLCLCFRYSDSTIPLLLKSKISRF